MILREYKRLDAVSSPNTYRTSKLLCRTVWAENGRDELFRNLICAVCSPRFVLQGLVFTWIFNKLCNWKGNGFTLYCCLAEFLQRVKQTFVFPYVWSLLLVVWYHLLAAVVPTPLTRTGCTRADSVLELLFPSSSVAVCRSQVWDIHFEEEYSSPISVFIYAFMAFLSFWPVSSPLSSRLSLVQVITCTLISLKTSTRKWKTSVILWTDCLLSLKVLHRRHHLIAILCRKWLKNAELMKQALFAHCFF